MIGFTLARPEMDTFYPILLSFRNHCLVSVLFFMLLRTNNMIPSHCANATAMPVLLHSLFVGGWFLESHFATYMAFMVNCYSEIVSALKTL